MESISLLYSPGLGRVLKYLTLKNSTVEKNEEHVTKAISELVQHTNAFEIGEFIRSHFSINSADFNVWISRKKESFSDSLSAINSELLVLQNQSGLNPRYCELLLQKARLYTGAGILGQAVDEFIVAKSWVCGGCSALKIDVELATVYIQFLAWKDLANLKLSKAFSVTDLIPETSLQDPSNSSNASTCSSLCLLLGIICFAQTFFKDANNYFSRCFDMDSSETPLPDYFQQNDLASMCLLSNIMFPLYDIHKTFAKFAPQIASFTANLEQANFQKATESIDVIRNAASPSCFSNSFQLALKLLKENLMVSYFKIYGRVSLNDIQITFSFSSSELLTSLVKLNLQKKISTRADFIQGNIYSCFNGSKIQSPKRSGDLVKSFTELSEQFYLLNQFEDQIQRNF